LNISNNTNNSSYLIRDSTSILIVDDEIDILSVIRRQLEDYGFNICSFTKPNIALEHYKTSSNTHHIVISDLQMPNMNGFEFLRKVKEINFNAKVFLMTCFEMNDLGELSLLSVNSSSRTKLMIDEFTRKPFSIEKLIILINKHMNRTKDPIAIT
jgi:two-component system, cell cycle response regulator CpdR